MTHGTRTTGGPAWRIGVAIAIVSAALIAFEIVLMRRLLLERWHHFGFLVISAALLGFGASGTLLAVTQKRIRTAPGRALCLLAGGFALSLVVVPRVAALVPLRVRFVPSELWEQVGWWAAYWLVLLVPFLLGAALIGAALMNAGARAGRVYGANLIGSGIGAALAAWLLSRWPIEYALWPSVALSILAVALLSTRKPTSPDKEPRASARAVKRTEIASDRASGRHPRLATKLTLLLCLIAIGAEAWWPLEPEYDEFKYAARLRLMVDEGAAELVTARADPHGYVELYASGRFHDLPFVALTSRPPPMYSLTINGDAAGSILRIDEAADAGVMDETLMALPYRLAPARPRVLLLGETGGANVWLARRRNAAAIDVVQPNAAVVDVLCEFGGGVLGETVRAHTRDAREFLADCADGAYDLVQIVSLEGLGGGAGLHGLAEDHLVTVEGIAECLRVLSSDGVLAVSRGIQQPPRENVRLLATLAEAFEAGGVARPGEHLVQARDYLGVCTMACASAMTEGRRGELRAAIDAFGLTPVWYDGVSPDEVNRPDALDGPEGSDVDWLHYAAVEVLSPRREAFYESWLTNVRPARDDRPFFWDFYKPSAVHVLRQAYGDLWLTRAELGRLFLHASIIIAATAAIVMILLPLAVAEWRRRRREDVEHKPVTATAGWLVFVLVYFGGIGLGFMGIEMALISRAIRWLGDPVMASALIIAAVLVISGVGSLLSGRVGERWQWCLPGAVAAAAVLMYVVGWHTAVDARLGPLALFVIAGVAALFMGMPMPAGIAVLNTRVPRLTPWAWGLNGAASVCATSCAIAIAMSGGYRAVMIMAAAAYALAATAALLNSLRLKTADETSAAT